MITINKKEEMEKYLVGNTYVIADDVTININLDLKCRDLRCNDLECNNLKCNDLECNDLECRNLKCRNLKCRNLECNDLECRNLKCSDLKCNNLECRDLECWDLKCRDLECRDLKCWDLKCRDLSYYAFAIAYSSFRCKTAKARRENGFHKCLDSEIEYIKDEPKETIKIGNVVFDKSEVEERLQGLEPLKGVE